MSRQLHARRGATRKDITPLSVTSVNSMENLAKITKGGSIVEASTSGFLMLVQRDELVPVEFRRNLNLDALIGEKVMIHLSDLNIEISGRIARTRFAGKGGFEIGIDYSDDAPEYWRECLVDLLPAPGELEDN